MITSTASSEVKALFRLVAVVGVCGAIAAAGLVATTIAFIRPDWISFDDLWRFGIGAVLLGTVGCFGYKTAAEVWRSCWATWPTCISSGRIWSRLMVVMVTGTLLVATGLWRPAAWIFLASTVVTFTLARVLLGWRGIFEIEGADKPVGSPVGP